MRKATGSYRTYSIPGKTAGLVHAFAVEDLPSAELCWNIFRSFKVCSDAKERVGCEKQREATAPIQSVVKLQPWFLRLRWKICLRQNCNLGSCACSELSALRQNTLMTLLVNSLVSDNTRPLPIRLYQRNQLERIKQRAHLYMCVRACTKLPVYYSIDRERKLFHIMQISSQDTKNP